MLPLLLYYFLLSSLMQQGIYATIDVNLSELQYLAARLNPFECRRLIAALHYNSYELPRNLAAAERQVDEEIPCLRQLLHWNSSPNEGRGKTHEAIVHRLRQLNRNDLADWLGKTAFKQLGKDLDRSMAKPFEGLNEEKTETPYGVTVEPIDETEEEEPWLPLDTVLMAVLLGLIGTLLILIAAVIFRGVMSRFRETRHKKSNEKGTDVSIIESYKGERKRLKTKHNDSSDDTKDSRTSE